MDPCFASTVIEETIFERLINPIGDNSLVPDGDCPICLEHLTDKPSGKCCCGGYSKSLKKCGHWLHVYCQIDRNPKLHICPLCRTVLIKGEDLYPILQTAWATILSKQLNT
jgi:hypothetical protein